MKNPRLHSSSTPVLAKYLLWASMGVMYFWCMTLPLVGKAGQVAPQHQVNFLTVLGLLLFAMGLSLLSGWVAHRHKTLSKGWWWWIGGQGFLLVLLIAGAFAV
ncbi:hypothetical protein P3T73_14055 [Kiritimatiellota bacterium B12222]|nr:hypothetical protein P3T73_14055 [Kiritimatiellota bacterium B12222]